MSTLYLMVVFDHTGFPADIVHSTDQPDVRYTINPGFFALPDDGPGIGEPVSEFDGYRLYRRTPLQALPADSIPVYQTTPGGALFVPTGAVFVRFADGVDASSRTKDIRQVGYDITEASPYNPNTAWVHATSGSLRDALNSLEKLNRIDQVVNVAPQFVTERHSRKKM